MTTPDVPTPTVLHCPICAQEERRVRLVPLGRFFVHEDGRQRARRCHATAFTAVVAQAAANQAKQETR